MLFVTRQGSVKKGRLFFIILSLPCYGIYKHLGITLVTVTVLEADDPQLLTAFTETDLARLFHLIRT